jgi:hypothetical protein
MFKRLVNKLFHGSRKVSIAEARTLIVRLREELAYLHELQAARLQGKDAVIQFFIDHPYVQVLQDFQEEEMPFDEILTDIDRQLNEAISVLEGSQCRPALA